MSRLIDADEFQKQIVGMTILNNYPPDKANALCKLVDSQPTAFDVKDVIEQLKEESEQSFVDFKSYAEEHGMDNDYEDWFYRGLIRAIEIVKRGGSDER